MVSELYTTDRAVLAVSDDSDVEEAAEGLPTTTPIEESAQAAQEDAPGEKSDEELITSDPSLATSAGDEAVGGEEAVTEAGEEEPAEDADEELEAVEDQEKGAEDDAAADTVAVEEGDMNPFSDDEEDEDEKEGANPFSSDEEDDGANEGANPFSDDEEDDDVKEEKEGANPFGDSDDDDEVASPLPVSGSTCVASPASRRGTWSAVPSPTPSATSARTQDSGGSAWRHVDSDKLSASTGSSVDGVSKEMLLVLIHEGFDKQAAAKALREDGGDINRARTALTAKSLAVSRGQVAGDLKFLWQSPIGLRVTSWLPEVKGTDGVGHTEYICRVTVLSTGASWSKSLRWKLFVNFDADLRRATEDNFVWMPKFPHDKMATLFGTSDAHRNERMEKLQSYFLDLVASAELMMHPEGRVLFEQFLSVPQNKVSSVMPRNGTKNGKGEGSNTNPIVDARGAMNRRRSAMLG